MWLDHENFAPFLNEVWRASVSGTGGLFLLANRLKLLKRKLKEWNRAVFKCNEVEIGRCLGLIAQLDIIEESDSWNEDLRIQRCVIKLELDKFWKRQEISWRQKSREIHLKLGDRNTSYFHKIANQNRRRNLVDRILVNGSIFVGQINLAPAIVSFFEGLYSEEIPWRPFPARHAWPSISREESCALTSRFSMKEVGHAIMNCAGEKAPGPDGFSMEFYKRHWATIQEQVMTAFADFFDRATLPVSVNCTFVCLIPKKETVEDVKDFRPISLTSSVYKIISKVLMERLRSVMPRLVSQNQCAFVHGRQILDATLLANELIDSRNLSGRPGLVIKLDIEKAFDHVNWNCLLQILGKMGFSEGWIRWIRACICSPSFSVLVNGESSGFFKSSRGLRQGDSLSPFLFILIMDVLSSIISVLKAANLIEGFFMKEAEREGEVTHLLYADDSILFCEASLPQVRGVLAALIIFQAITGLKVNLKKCSISQVGNVDNIIELADVLGCGVESFPISYLGLPLGSRAVNGALWNPVVTKVRTRLETWKARHLSFGGRLTLVKSVLSNLPIYYLSLFRAPNSVIKAIEKIQNNFLWSGMSDSKKFHMVSWDRVKIPKRRGGLGVMDLRSMNVALLGKWLWRFGVERNAWWRKLIRVKFGLERGSDWRSACNRSSSGWSIWFWILKVSPDFWGLASVDPGGGEWVRFWVDTWVPGKHLGREFPRIAAAAQSPDAFISDICFVDGRTQWNLQLTTQLRGGALDELQRLMDLLNNLPPWHISSGPPRLRWKEDEPTGFSVNSMMTALLLDRFPGCNHFPYTAVWIHSVPTKICSFIWMASLNAIATIDNLRRRGVIIPNRCVLCCQAEESPSHLLLHCSFSSEVWSRFSNTCGIQGPFQHSILGLLQEWNTGPTLAHFGKFRKVVHQAICWYLWIERNDRIFRDTSSSKTQLAWKIAFNTARWLQAHNQASADECSHWLNAIFHPP
ncbi:Putative ribonuclease H protein At1g65750 [Linum grandiflorum]